MRMNMPKTNHNLIFRGGVSLNALLVSVLPVFKKLKPSRNVNLAQSCCEEISKQHKPKFNKNPLKNLLPKIQAPLPVSLSSKGRGKNNVTNLLPYSLNPLFPKNVKNLSTYPLMSLSTSKKAAFTLAEVLITLGIIGVVAAMTIPGLITTYKAHQFHSQFLKSYSVLQQMLRRMQDDEITFDTNMAGYIKNYLTGAIYCGNYYTFSSHEAADSPCFYQNNKNHYKTYDGQYTVGASAMDDGQYVLADGTNIYLQWDNTWNKIEDSRHWIYIDINGYKNGPNRWGVDLFTFQLVNGEVLAFGDDGTFLESGDDGTVKEAVTADEYCNIEKPGQHNGIACSHLAKSQSDYFKKAVKLK